MTTFSQVSWKFFRFSILYWVAVAAGVFLWSREWEIVRLASTKQEEDLFGLFGFCVLCVMAFVAYTDFKPQTLNSIKKIILAGLPYLVCLIFLSYTIELSRESWDYAQYETAFRAIAAGNNPYLSTRYLYPPFFADLMVLVFRIGLRLFPLLGLGKSAWVFVFYIHQSSLLFFLLLAYALSMQFARQIGLDEITGSLLVSAIFLFNVPILRTLSNNQVNFYVLVSILGTLVLLQTYPFFAGIAVALGGFIKLYPFALSAPLLGIKKWRALGGVLAGSTLIAIFEILFLHKLKLWEQFVQFYLSFPVEQESSLFRNTSPMSLLRSVLKFSGISLEILPLLFGVTVLAVLIWYSVRFFQREKIVIPAGWTSMELHAFRNIGHLLDFSVLSLLIAPSAWEHHYVIAIPLAIWVFAFRGKDAPWQVILSLALVFVLPVFNVFPFSYLRMAGLIWLFMLASPKQIEKSLII
ncbi:MAG: glycosyltransferase family 87 protein [Anaerolineales bacterium]